MKKRVKRRKKKMKIVSDMKNPAYKTRPRWHALTKALILARESAPGKSVRLRKKIRMGINEAMIIWHKSADSLLWPKNL